MGTSPSKVVFRFLLDLGVGIVSISCIIMLMKAPNGNNKTNVHVYLLLQM